MRSGTAGVSRALALLAAFVAASLVSGALVAGLFIPAVGATGALTRSGVDYFNSLDSSVKQIPLPQGSTMYASDGKTVIAKFFQENRTIIPLSKIAPVMQHAIVAIEDSRFYKHGGVDPKGVIRAFVNNAMSKQVEGASTLTQQYIKNINVETALANGDTAAAQAATAKNYSRKLQELRQAIALEKVMTKDQILENYLNIALFGNNTYGIEAAAQYFFSTSASSLTLTQAALLAGLVQSPTMYNPFSTIKPGAIDRATHRRNQVLTRMYQLGMIKNAEYTAAMKAPLGLKKKVPLNGCITAQERAYFCDYALHVMLIDPGFANLGKTQDDRLGAIQRGGLSIVTTMDPKIENAAWQAVSSHIPVTDPSKVAASAVTVESGTGRVLSIAQNRIYALDKKPGHTTLNYGVDEAYGGSNGFQTGSTFKAFTLATWLQAGKSLYDTVNSTPSSMPFSAFTSCGAHLVGGTYSYGNTEPGANGDIRVIDATAASVNKAFVPMEAELDLCDLANTAMKLGVHRGASQKHECTGKLSTQIPACVPSLTLGPIDISPLTMATAYAAFGHQGITCTPVAIQSITVKASGKKFNVPQTKCTQGVSADVALGVTYALKGVLTHGTAAGQGLNVPSAGKTGTTNGSSNTWFVGYTPFYSTAVWVADPNVYAEWKGQRPLENMTIAGTYYSNNFFGATLAAPIWHSIMSVASQGKPSQDWPAPGGSMVANNAPQGGVPNVVGKSVGAAMAALAQAGYQPQLGGQVPGPAPRGSVASTSPAAGTNAPPGTTVIVNISDGSQGGRPKPGPRH